MAVVCIVLGPFGFAGGLSGLCTLINDAGVRCLGRAIAGVRVRDSIGRVEILWFTGRLLLNRQGGWRDLRVRRG